MTKLKYIIIHKNNSPNPHSRWISEAISNHQPTNPLETKYTASNDAQAIPLMDLWMMESMVNDDRALSWSQIQVSKP